MFSLFSSPFKVEWKGHYWVKGKKLNLDIQNMMSEPSGKLTGNGYDREGKFDIEGFIAPDGTITFQKNYKRGVSSRVYRGQFTNGFLTGNWVFNGESEPFMLKMDEGKPYLGYYHRPDINMPLTIPAFIKVTKKGIFGIGRDLTGAFVVTGTAKTKTDYEFKISYINQFCLENVAKRTKNNLKRNVLEGTWVNEAINMAGQFRLLEQAPALDNKGRFMSANSGPGNLAAGPQGAHGAPVGGAGDQPAESPEQYRRKITSMFNPNGVVGGNGGEFMQQSPYGKGGLMMSNIACGIPVGDRRMPGDGQDIQILAKNVQR